MRLRSHWPWLVVAATTVAGTLAVPRAQGEAGGTVPCAGGLLVLATGLCWQDPPDNRALTWTAAVDYCATLEFAGHSPGSWRMPTIDELRSLIRGCPVTAPGGECGVTGFCHDPGCRNDPCQGCPGHGGPGSGGAYWPTGFGGIVDIYWSSTHAGRPSKAGRPSHAWYVYFSTGHVGRDWTTYPQHVRCVRAGP